MSDETESGNLTFKDKYIITDTWQEKAVLISLYHQAMCIRFDGKNGKYKWTIADTAEHFDVSSGLVSENIRLAKAIDDPLTNKRLMAAKTREEGLRLIERRRYVRIIGN